MNIGFERVLIPKARNKGAFTKNQKKIIKQVIDRLVKIKEEQKDFPESIKIKVVPSRFKESQENILEDIRELMKRVGYEYKDNKMSFSGGTTIISHYLYETGKNSIEIKVIKESMELLYQIFPPGKTKQEVSFDFKGDYTRVFYDIINACDVNDTIHISLDELKERLNILGKYEMYSAFKRYILNPSIKELTEKADRCFDYFEIKESRKIESLMLHVKENMEYKRH